MLAKKVALSDTCALAMACNRRLMSFWTSVSVSTCACSMMSSTLGRMVIACSTGRGDTLVLSLMTYFPGLSYL